MAKKPLTAGEWVKGLLGLCVIVGVVYACTAGGPPGANVDQELANLTTWYVDQPPKGHKLIIWRDDIAKDKGEAFIAAGEFRSHATQMLGLIACVVEPGTKLIVSGAGIFTRTAAVVSGPHDGCEGSVDVTGLTHQPPPPRPAR